MIAPFYVILFTMNSVLDKKVQFKISVRNLVEFILRCGDIDDRKGSGDSLSAMKKGAELHRRIQSAMGGNYHAEVTLNHTVDFGNYELSIEGRADGIIIDDETVVIDEIKGVYRDVMKMEEPDPVHLAQAKCYAYIYAAQNDLEFIGVTMTYGNLEKKKEINRFLYNFSFEDISAWFEDLMDKYRRWGDFSYHWQFTKMESVSKVEFPFAYRPGQRKLAGNVYSSIARNKTLFIEAPCGTGKTISTIFPAVKAIGESLSERIFYLTAKTAARAVAMDTFSLLQEKGLRFKTVEITAKDKICPLEERACNPDECPYAKGHYDRINDAIYDLITSGDYFGRDNIINQAELREVCPFELSLDVASFSDGIVGDYNYVFDPNVALKRFFSEGIKGRFIFLVDEAHNMVDRAREMYSAVIEKEKILSVKRLFKTYNGGIPAALDKVNRKMLAWKREAEGLYIPDEIDSFIASLMNVATAMEKFFEKRLEIDGRDEILDFYFDVRHFLNMSDYMDKRYTVYCDYTDESHFFVKLLCIDPSRQLQERIDMSDCTVFFSATLLPVDYYRRLLCVDDDVYCVYAKSPFDSSNRHVMIGRDVSSLYRRRSDSEYELFAKYIADIVSAKKGNYMVFGPSYNFLDEVYERVERLALNDTRLIIQTSSMSDKEREEFLEEFSEESGNQTLVGFCVMGGVFSEGIDLVGDRLIGAIVLGVGLPMVSNERKLIQEHFGREDGFSYAYIYPGMNKVLQAAGRVIRTEDDVGIVALLDERFLKNDYIRVFPMEWQDVKAVTQPVAKGDIKAFWDQKNG